jgi:NADPH:quinone reductase-like Zn-dependent oxidoreductase
MGGWVFDDSDVTIKAARIHRFGPPEVIVIDDVPGPAPAAGQVLVRVASAGVGPWDALIREGHSVVNSPLPLTLGSDLSGVVEALGPGETQFKPGDKVYGVTNPEFIGACAEYALASTKTIAPKPEVLSFAEAASAPVVAVTAWQMVFEYANAKPGETVLILGAGGNVGGYAVQFARQAGLRVFATASADDAEYVRSLGAASVIDYQRDGFEEVTPMVDIVLDMVGGDTRKRSLKAIRPGGILVTVVSEPMPSPDDLTNIRSVFFLVEVTTERLARLTNLFNQGKVTSRVGAVLPLEQVRSAHEMLGGASHKRGKIVLNVADVDSRPGNT